MKPRSNEHNYIIIITVNIPNKDKGPGLMSLSSALFCVIFRRITIAGRLEGLKIRGRGVGSVFVLETYQKLHVVS